MNPDEEEQKQKLRRKVLRDLTDPRSRTSRAAPTTAAPGSTAAPPSGTGLSGPGRRADVTVTPTVTVQSASGNRAEQEAAYRDAVAKKRS